MTSLTQDETKCKAIIGQGPRVGLQCLKDRLENGYCVYHKRNYEYEQLLSQGKKLCNGFFRGCDIELTADDLKKKRKFCSECRLKKSGKSFPCQVKTCTARIEKEEDKYCNNHVRELLRDHEKQDNVQYCDISRGCFNLLIDDVKCSVCRDKEKAKSAHEMNMLRTLHGICLPERQEKDELFEKQEQTAPHIKDVWRLIQRNAITRNKLFTLSQEEFEKIVIQPCYYCGFYSKHKFLGIDRINNTKGYILSNCITCCKMCNMMKGENHPLAFLDKVSLIISYRQNPKSILLRSHVKWPSYFSHGRIQSYKEYQKDITTRVRKLTLNLTQTQYESLIDGECYLCGIHPMEGHRNGIDRVDNNGDYTLENSRSCCGHCNFMKREYMYEDFIRKCIQIKSYNCNKTIFNGVGFVDEETLKLRNEYYTAEDITKFLKDGHLERFIYWCEEKEKTKEFIGAITHIAKTVSGDIESQIRKELDLERARKANQAKSPVKKHLHSTTIYAWLIGGNDKQFLDWYLSQYEKTSMFDSCFDELLNIVHTLSKDDGLKACKKFMYDEKSRRNTQRMRNDKKSGYKTYSTSNESLVDRPEDSSKILSPSKNVLVKLTPVSTPIPPVNLFVDTVVKRQNEPKTTSSKPIPKQWKVADVYSFITSGNESAYYEYIKVNNKTDTVLGFEDRWSTLITNIRGKTKDEADDTIRAFILYLRNIRHNEICTVTNAKRVIEKEDRQHYRTDGILVILNTKNPDEITKFKTHSEAHAGDKADDPKWIKRWKGFLDSVDKAETDEVKKKLISSFLLAQRKKKTDMSK
jgi:hypothetical protein